MAEERLSLLPLLFLSLIFRNMDSEELEAFQQELTCSICMNCFLDPVTIDCGHSFCRPCLSLCWEEDQTPRSCPECRGIAERPDFKTNIALKRLASLARQARADHNHSSKEQICETHQEARGLFWGWPDPTLRALLWMPWARRSQPQSHTQGCWGIPGRWCLWSSLGSRGS